MSVCHTNTTSTCTKANTNSTQTFFQTPHKMQKRDFHLDIYQVGMYCSAWESCTPAACMKGIGSTCSAHTKRGNLACIPQTETGRSRPSVQLKGYTASLLMPWQWHLDSCFRLQCSDTKSQNASKWAFLHIPSKGISWPCNFENPV